MIEQAKAGVKTFVMKAAVTGHLEGSLKDWPPRIQDLIYAKLEDMALRVELPLVVVYSACETAYDDDGEPDGHFVHVIASEVVVKLVDNREDAKILDALKHTMGSMQ